MQLIIAPLLWTVEEKTATECSAQNKSSMSFCPSPHLYSHHDGHCCHLYQYSHIYHYHDSKQPHHHRDSNLISSEGQFQCTPTCTAKQLNSLLQEPHYVLPFHDSLLRSQWQCSETWCPWWLPPFLPEAAARWVQTPRQGLPQSSNSAYGCWQHWKWEERTNKRSHAQRWLTSLGISSFLSASIESRTQDILGCHRLKRSFSLVSSTRVFTDLQSAFT